MGEVQKPCNSVCYTPSSETFRIINHLGRLESVLENNLREKGFKDLGWKWMAQDRSKWYDFMNIMVNLRVPKAAGSYLTSSNNHLPVT
jgi:hypothetical protein